MKKNIIVVSCLVLLTLFPGCRKKSKTEKQLEKATKAQMKR